MDFTAFYCIRVKFVMKNKSKIWLNPVDLVNDNAISLLVIIVCFKRFLISHSSQILITAKQLHHSHSQTRHVLLKAT